MQCQRRLQIYRLKNIDEVFELSGVAFRLAPPYGWLLEKTQPKCSVSEWARRGIG